MSKTAASAGKPGVKKKRVRRTTEEIIQLIIDAASEEFQQKGFAGTTTADISKKAGVAEPLIFSHFGSKAQLFHDVIFKALNQHFVSFCDDHLVEPGDAGSFRKNSEEYINEITSFLNKHSKMLMSLFVSQLYGDSSEGNAPPAIEGLENYFQQASSMAKSVVGEQAAFSPELMVRLSFSTMLASVLFKNWLFPEGLATPEEIDAATKAYVIDGLNANVANLNEGSDNGLNTSSKTGSNNTPAR